MEYLTYNTKEGIYVKLKNYSSKYMEDEDPGVEKNHTRIIELEFLSHRISDSQQKSVCLYKV
jgi:hypothetical protein